MECQIVNEPPRSNPAQTTLFLRLLKNEFVVNMIFPSTEQCMGEFKGTKIIKRFPLTPEHRARLVQRAKRFKASVEMYLAACMMSDLEQQGFVENWNTPVLLQLARKIQAEKMASVRKRLRK